MQEVVSRRKDELPPPQLVGISHLRPHFPLFHEVPQFGSGSDRPLDETRLSLGQLARFTREARESSSPPEPERKIRLSHRD